MKILNKILEKDCTCFLSNEYNFCNWHDGFIDSIFFVIKWVVMISFLWVLLPEFTGSIIESLPKWCALIK